MEETLSDDQKFPEERQHHIAVNAQYIKDLSFENPSAPASLVNASKTPPMLDVTVDIKVQKLKDDTFEVSLILQSTAKSDDQTLFVAELNYASVFTVQVPENELEPVLMIYCPSVMFPFARRILADATRDGGFPPLMLDPIDFSRLYRQHKQATNDNGSGAVN